MRWTYSTFLNDLGLASFTSYKLVRRRSLKFPYRFQESIEELAILGSLL
jgi:hypothetical protein